MLVTARLARFLTLFGLLAMGSIAPIEVKISEHPVIVVAHVTVVDVVEGRLVSDMSITIAGDRIKAVGPSAMTPIPPGARVIDGSRQYVIPGLWDMHVHIDDGARWFLPLAVVNGVTGLRDMGSSLDRVAVWHRMALTDSLAPRILAAGPIVTGMVNDSDVRLVRVSDSVTGERIVDTLVRAGVDFIKVYDWLSADAYAGVMSAARRNGIPVSGHLPVAISARQAVLAGQRTIEHFGNAVAGLLVDCSTDELAIRRQLRDLLTPPIDPPGILQRRTSRYNAHLLDTYSPAKAAALARFFARHGTRITPTILTFSWRVLMPEGRMVAGDPALRYVPGAIRDMAKEMDAEAARHRVAPGDSTVRVRLFQRQMELLRAFHRAGVSLLAGTDTGPYPGAVAGFALHEELVKLVEAGLRPLDALRAATIEPARYLGGTDSLGSISPGKVADLVLLEANPLVDIHNTERINAVMVRGHFIDQAGRQQMLARLEQEATN